MLLTACASTPVKDPVLAGILDVERYPGTKKTSKVNDLSGDCDIIGRYCTIGYGFCEDASSEKQASNALQYYKKELNNIGWVTDTKDKSLNNKSIKFKSNRTNNRKYKTTLNLDQGITRGFSFETNRVCFSFIEDENYNKEQSDIINALQTLEKTKP